MKKIHWTFCISNIFALNIDCGYTLESPCRGASNEYLQCMFMNKNRKLYTLVSRSLTIYKRGLMGYLFHGHVFPMLLCWERRLVILLVVVVVCWERQLVILLVVVVVCWERQLVILLIVVVVCWERQLVILLVLVVVCWERQLVILLVVVVVCWERQLVILLVVVVVCWERQLDLIFLKVCIILVIRFIK